MQENIVGKGGKSNGATDSRTIRKGVFDMEQNMIKIFLEKIWRHCAPFYCANSGIHGAVAYYSRYDLISSGFMDTDKGTLTFVEFQGKHFALTHFNLCLAMLEGESLEVSLGERELWDFILFSEPFRGLPDHVHKLIFSPLSNSDAGLLKAARKEAIVLPREAQEINEGDIVISAGFSMDEQERTLDSSRFSHVLGAIDFISGETFCIRSLDPERTKKIPFGGMKGGPIFKVDENSGTYTFIGIIKQTHGFKGQGLAQSESDTNIHVVGQTVNGMHLKRLMDESKTTRKESKEAFKWVKKQIIKS